MPTLWALTPGRRPAALPAGLRRGLVVQRLRGGGVRVRLRVPALLYRWSSPASVGATASLGQAGR